MDPRHTLIGRLIGACLDNTLIVTLLAGLFLALGVANAPFDWDVGLPRDPVPVDAIPDTGENQQIVFTEWTGRSPQDIEDQVSYPLTVALLGVPGVKTIRSASYFGFSSIFVIFQEDVEFYWSRSRILEKLASLPPGTLPDGVSPALGPDATPLGQIFWYTLEGQDEEGHATGGWDLHELRSVQDWTVRYALQGVAGVAEVASIGGFVQEYQVDVDPDAMRARNVTIEQIERAVAQSNLDVGAGTIDMNGVEYLVRGVGFLKDVDDLARTAITASSERNPIYIEDVAHVGLGPAARRGALDKMGAETVGGVVVARYGANPLAVIDRVVERIEEISPGLPSKRLADGRVSKLAIVPFYDRTKLIHETLGTLSAAIFQQILITVIVVLVMVRHLRGSMLVSSLLPFSVLFSFVCMRRFGVDANIVALSGIAIAIGTMVDLGIVLTENTLQHMDDPDSTDSVRDRVHLAAAEVAPALLTAVATTVVSFLPVFFMDGPEGRLFKPLAFTKTFALIGAAISALTLLPVLATWLFARRSGRSDRPAPGAIAVLALGAVLLFVGPPWMGGFALAYAGLELLEARLPGAIRSRREWLQLALVVVGVAIALAADWVPLGGERSNFANLMFVAVSFGVLLGAFAAFKRAYPWLLATFLAHKLRFALLPTVTFLFGMTAWMGVDVTLGFVPDFARANPAWRALTRAFPGVGQEFMPALDEGSFLYMPTTMPHASIGEALDQLQTLDRLIASVPEVDTVVGKLGRAGSPLDTAPISMFEIVVNYRSEYLSDEQGRPLRFVHDGDSFTRDAAGDLIPDPSGRSYRVWRDKIQSSDDIWTEIVNAAQLPGVTSAPKLQPIAARTVMLQSGMRAPMGVKIKGPTLEALETAGLQIERLLKEVPEVNANAVIADRVVGKPYLEIVIDREAIARFGISVQGVQNIVEVAIGGRTITRTVEGRQRYPVRVRYMRELRDRPDSLGDVLITGIGGVQIPLRELAEIRYVRGPQVIKSEDTFLISYVVFDMKAGHSEVEVVRAADRHLRDAIDSGEFEVPAGVSFVFAGAFENQVRSQQRLMLILPLAMFVIFLLIYLQFKSVTTSLIVFSGVAIAFSGGFILIWLYGSPHFLDVSLFGVNLRDTLGISPVNLSVAVWVGFIALFGIATDDGVLMSSTLDRTFARERPNSVEQIRATVLVAGQRRIRPCLMTTATTLLALLPILTSSGRGADIMMPMAIPAFGGMLIALLTLFVVPVLYCSREEWLLERGSGLSAHASAADPPN
ncbi:MAG: efflux RND transporter permease subunit [Myxococcales bacterium]|nr:efflux RND transporter permease subunit [Myxococcales bacterium]